MMKNYCKVEKKEGKNMSGTIRSLILALVLGLIMLSSGCAAWTTPGLTHEEYMRNKRRLLRVNSQGIMDDFDRIMMLDRPSRLTDKRIP
jgi:hypothetical protein